MKQQVVFIHGGDSFSKKKDFLTHLKQAPIRNLPGKQSFAHFTQTLAEDLGETHEVFMPGMPNKQNADFDEWSLWFERHFEYLQGEVILVGWSLGGMFLAKYLSEREVPFTIAKLLLLAAPCGRYESLDGNDCGNFQFDVAQVGKIAERAKKVFILHSEDDFVVPIQAAFQYKTAIPTAELVVFKDKNHFLSPEFPELVQILTEN